MQEKKKAKNKEEEEEGGRRRKKKKKRRRWWWSQRLPTRECKGKKLPRRKKAPTTKWQTKHIGELFDIFYLSLPLTSSSTFIVFVPGLLCTIQLRYKTRVKTVRGRESGS